MFEVLGHSTDGVSHIRYLFIAIQQKSPLYQKGLKFENFGVYGDSGSPKKSCYFKSLNCKISNNQIKLKKNERK